jgi:hypothetical protein
LRSFAEFWPYYLREHSRPATRAVHFIGTTAALGLIAAAAARQSWPLLAAAPVAGYGFAWLSHLLCEHNRPATFKHPLWSLAADFKMWWCAITRTLGGEIDRHSGPTDRVGK